MAPEASPEGPAGCLHVNVGVGGHLSMEIHYFPFKSGRSQPCEPREPIDAFKECLEDAYIHTFLAKVLADCILNLLFILYSTQNLAGL